MNDEYEGSEIERTLPIEVDTGTLAVLNKGEIDIQIATAKRYPRSLKAFRDEVKTLSTLSEETAEECSYVLKRKAANGSTKLIVGPSARFAEILASSWGNCRAGARVVDDRGQFVVAQGVFLDMQKNTYISYEVQRRVVDSKGRRYSDDMIGVTANAACSIALRNAILKGVPKALWNDLWAGARAVAVGDGKSIGERRQRALAKLAQLGVDEKRVLDRLERASVEEITLDDLEVLFSAFATIREGEMSVDEAFSLDTSAAEIDKSTGEIRSGADKLAAALRERSTQRAAAPASGGAGGSNSSTTGTTSVGTAPAIDSEALRQKQQEQRERAAKRAAGASEQGQATSTPPASAAQAGEAPKAALPPLSSLVAGAKKATAKPAPEPEPAKAATEPSENALTYAEIAEAINTAESEEDFNLCGAAIEQHYDDEQAKELSVLLDQRKAAVKPRQRRGRG